MAQTIEFLKDQRIGARTGKLWLDPCRTGAARAGFDPRWVSGYHGEVELLTLWGIGKDSNIQARKQHLAKGGHVINWDMGYLGRPHYARVSIDVDHPSHALMENTEPDPSRWEHFGLKLYNVANPKGHVVVVGLGAKSRVQFKNGDTWEQKALLEAKARFPDRRIVYRPKPSKYEDKVQWEHRSEVESIYRLLQGASLVICKHSNVAVDACISGVPVECDGGAALWLYNRCTTPTVAQRLDFLYRVCWWQWKLDDHDMEVGWKFLRTVLGSMSARAGIHSMAGLTSI